jgi:hypothetical protein
MLNKNFAPIYQFVAVKLQIDMWKYPYVKQYYPYLI